MTVVIIDIENNWTYPTFKKCSPIEFTELLTRYGIRKMEQKEITEHLILCILETEISKTNAAKKIFELFNNSKK